MSHVQRSGNMGDGRGERVKPYEEYVTFPGWKSARLWPKAATGWYNEKYQDSSDSANFTKILKNLLVLENLTVRLVTSVRKLSHIQPSPSFRFAQLTFYKFHLRHGLQSNAQGPVCSAVWLCPPGCRAHPVWAPLTQTRPGSLSLDSDSGSDNSQCWGDGAPPRGGSVLPSTASRAGQSARKEGSRPAEVTVGRRA